jgi:hypothetical protein
VFKHPARKDIRNAKFVIVQDISSSMRETEGALNICGKVREKYELAYHFGMAIKEFLEKNGARVETYRFNDSGAFMEGLSMEAQGGTEWEVEMIDQMVSWIQAGKQVILITDGEVAFRDTPAIRSLFAHALRRPVGLRITGGIRHDMLAAVYPDWVKFSLTQAEPERALDEIVSELSKGYRW